MGAEAQREERRRVWNISKELFHISTNEFYLHLFHVLVRGVH